MLVAVAMAASVFLVGAAGTVAAAEDPCWENPEDCTGTGPTIPDDPMQSLVEDTSRLTEGFVVADIDSDPCWEDGDWTDCGGTGPTNPNPE